MRAKAKPSNSQPTLVVDSEVVRQIRQHARSSSKTEVCGVLIGQDRDHRIEVAACIEGQNAEEAGAHVTFTQDTWEHIYAVKDQKYPDKRIVGWYHSHPGFGVFLSDHDTFIHKNFFSSPQQVAWVYDPHSDEEGCFGWEGERLKRLPKIDIVDRRGGELAGGSDGRDHRSSGDRESAKDEFEETPRKRAIQSQRRDDFEDLDENKDIELSRLTNIVFAVFSYLTVFLLGAVLTWYFLPRIVVVPVDPFTGQPIGTLPGDPGVKPGPQNGAPQPGPSNSAQPQRSDGHKQ